MVMPMSDYQQRREQTRKAAEDYAQRADNGEVKAIYRFGEPLIDEADIDINRDEMHMPGYEQKVVFGKTNPWGDMS